MTKKNSKPFFRKRLYDFVLRLIAFIDTLPKDSASQVIGKQLLRSGTSILSNYVEANSASSRKDFINFFTHSLKSGNESEIWLCLLRDSQRGNQEGNKILLAELDEIVRIIATSILTLKGKK